MPRGDQTYRDADHTATSGNYRVASIAALILLVPSVLFMLLIERFLRADVLMKVGA